MNILLADDHRLIRDGMKPFLEELAPEVRILEASTLDEALQVAGEADSLDLVLLDLKMPGMAGFDGIRQVSERYPGVPVVILSGFFDRRDVLAAMKHGAAGYIPKTMSGEAVVNALRLVFSGEMYLPSVAFTDSPEATDASSEAEEETWFLREPLSKLSTREREVLGALINGHSNKEMARKLGILDTTVKIHLRNIYRKIGASNRVHAAKIAMQCGWKT